MATKRVSLPSVRPPPAALPTCTRTKLLQPTLRGSLPCSWLLCRFRQKAESAECALSRPETCSDFKTRPKKITNPQLLMSFLYALNQWGAWRPFKTLNSAAVFRFGGAKHMLHKGGLVWKEGGEFQAFLRTFTPSEAGMRDRLPLNSDVSPAFDHV